MNDELRRVDAAARRLVQMKLIWEADLAWEMMKRAEEAYWKQRRAPQEAQDVEDLNLRAGAEQIRVTGEEES